MKHSSRDRLELALTRIADPDGEGVRACLTVYADRARAEADAADARARSDAPLGPLDGTIVSIKDLFDVRGEPTRAGSKILAEEAKPAEADAAVVERLRQAGAVIIAKTNMTEFAFSGVGTNPHYGTPGNPRDRARVPGGSSAGAPVAVADGMCAIAIGSDTGGSVRIPASLCGLTGFKPSKQRVPTTGAFPLSFTLDSIGPIAANVADCALADAVMAGEEVMALEPVGLGGLRIGIVEGMPLEGLDATVGDGFFAAIERLGGAGARVTNEVFPLFDDMAAINAKGGIAPAEACAIHRDRLTRRPDDFDPNVRFRIARGGTVAASDYIDALRARAVLVRAMDARLQGLDAVAMPTTPILAPTIAEVADPKVFSSCNAALLRNTSIANFFDLCAISLPLPGSGLPAGLMLISRNGDDRRLLRIAATVERLLGA
jgi:aspartyl-tRNA(Asn)/glutamyl-tRNA(Gln) amidotransferase subunit A